MTARDTSKYATALMQATQAVATAVERNLMQEQTAVEVIASVAGRLGVAIDPADELASARADLAKREEGDAFVGADIKHDDGTDTDE